MTATDSTPDPSTPSTYTTDGPITPRALLAVMAVAFDQGAAARAVDEDPFNPYQATLREWVDE